LVKQTLVYLDEVCGGAQSLGLFIHEDNANIVIQCLRVRVTLGRVAWPSRHDWNAVHGQQPFGLKLVDSKFCFHSIRE
jgi:hypothetical protein